MNCAICCENINSVDSYRISNCVHHFHKDCITEWIKGKHYSCPLCREDIGVTTLLQLGISLNISASDKIPPIIPAPVMRPPAPAPVVRPPAPAPVMRPPALAPVMRPPVPAPVMRPPAPTSIVRTTISITPQIRYAPAPEKSIPSAPIQYSSNAVVNRIVINPSITVKQTKYEGDDIYELVTKTKKKSDDDCVIC
jgi:hypothetical protein